MSTRDLVLQQQRRWADAAGHPVDARGYLPTVEANLRRPLSAQARADFEKGSGSELLDLEARPAKMRALHSSSALAVNVFDAWSAGPARPLIHALGFEGALSRIRFEAQYRTRLRGTPPNLDVALTLEDGHVIAIESKFCEWLAPKSTVKPAFTPAYFADADGLWDRLGLPAAQTLANAIRTGAAGFVYLDAPQLLKHMLGLATHLGTGCSLVYVYLDQTGPESALHRAEVARFTDHIGPTLGFRALSYQDLISRLSATEGVEPDYLAYVGQRYGATAIASWGQSREV